MGRKTTLLRLIDEKLSLVLRLLDRLGATEQTMSAQLDQLKAQVQKNSDVTQSAVTLINGLSDQIKALKDDPAAIAKLADDLKAQADSLSAAVVANTPTGP